MILRHLLPGQFVAFAGWHLPDDSVISQKITRRQADDHNAGKVALVAPVKDAVLLIVGVRGAVDTVDGFLHAGDCLEGVIDGQKLLCVVDGEDAGGLWSAAYGVSRKDANGGYVIGKDGAPVADVVNVTVAHQRFLPQYNETDPAQTVVPVKAPTVAVVASVVGV